MSKAPPKKGSGTPAGTTSPFNPLKQAGASAGKVPPQGAATAKPSPLAKPPAGAPATAPKAAPAAAPSRPAPPAVAAKPIAAAAPGAAAPAKPAPKVPPRGAAPARTVVGSGKVTLSSGSGKAGAGIMAQMKAAGSKKEAGPTSEDLVERVLEIPGFNEVAVPKVFGEFVEKVVPRLDLPSTTRELLREFANIDVTAERVGQVIKQNPYYENQFYRVIESMGRKREDVPRLEGAVVMLGMQNSRNLLLALQAIRTVRRTHPEWDKNGKLRVSPNDVLKYALKCEEALAGNKSGYADTAYAAGLLFDVFALAAQEVIQDNPVRNRVSAYIDTLFVHGLKSAQVALELAKVMPDFSFKRYLFAACLFHDIGKAALAIVDPGYLDFLDECSKRDVPRAVRQFAEERRFGASHAALGALICNYSRMFRPIERAILFHHQPVTLAKGDRNLHQLCQLVCLATNVASHYKRTDKTDDPIIALWKGPELAGFRIDNRALISAVAKVG